MNILLVFIFTLLYMMGGQFFGKWLRRYGAPSVGIAFAMFKTKERKDRLKYLWLALIAVVLSCGYGEDSFLRRMVKGNDIACRLLYGALLAIPFCILGFWWALLILPVAFVIRAGSLGRFILFNHGVDILIEDIIRGAGISVCILSIL